MRSTEGTGVPGPVRLFRLRDIVVEAGPADTEGCYAEVLEGASSAPPTFVFFLRAACRARAFLLLQLREQYFEFGRAILLQFFHAQTRPSMATRASARSRELATAETATGAAAAGACDLAPRPEVLSEALELADRAGKPEDGLSVVPRPAPSTDAPALRPAAEAEALGLGFGRGRTATRAARAAWARAARSWRSLSCFSHSTRCRSYSS